MIVGLTLALVVLAARPPEVTIERATVPWSELERLLRREGAKPERNTAPRDYSIPSLEVSGDVAELRAALSIDIEIDVLAGRWTVVPLLPGSMAIASADITTPPSKRGILARDGDRIAFVAEGAGRYSLHLSAELALERAAEGWRLAIAPPSLMGGRAHLTITGSDRVLGRTVWRSRSTKIVGQLEVEATLGDKGLDLVLPLAEERTSLEDVQLGLEHMHALTVVSLDGRGVTRILVDATPGPSKRFDLELPKGARLWKSYAGRRSFAPAQIADGELVHIPLERRAQIEVAYTFDAPRLGIKGRYRVELPRLPVEAQGVRWELWLPNGLEYEDTQASMPASTCDADRERARTEIERQGRCFGFGRAVLEPQSAYVEGSYAQHL